MEAEEEESGLLVEAAVQELLVSAVQCIVMQCSAVQCGVQCPLGRGLGGGVPPTEGRPARASAQAGAALHCTVHCALCTARK
jgi:hypothetical protein